MKTDIGDFLHDFMKCLIFLIIHITSVISNSVDQYFVSTDENCLFKNIMNWIWFLLNFSFFSESFTTWNIMTLNLICLNAFTFMRKSLYEIKCIKKFGLLKIFCKCWYDSCFFVVSCFNILTIENRFLKLFLLDSYFKNRIFRF